MLIENIEVIDLIFQYLPSMEFRHSGGVCTGRLMALVRVQTNDGRQGWGSAYSHPGVMRLIIEQHLQPHLLGHDPRQTEFLWDKMYDLIRWYGRKGAAVSTLGALDKAFWDLRAQAAGQPLYRLLDGENGNVPAYASGSLWVDDVRQLKEETARYRDDGFLCAKCRRGHSKDYDIAAIAAIQRGLGPDGLLIVDGPHRYDLATAVWLGEILAEKDVFSFEEPFAPDALDDYSALPTRVDVSISAGENEFGVLGFRELMRAQAIDIAQPDASGTGGITASMLIGQMALRAGIRVAPHRWGDAIALIANAHVVAALPNGITVEVDRTGNPFIDDLLQQPATVEDGMLELGDAPRLGIDVNMKVVERLRLPAGQPIPDGSYSDLVFGQAYYSETPTYDALTNGDHRI